MSACPDCGSWQSKTLATRKDTRYNWKYRKRECECGTVFETYEICVDSLTLGEPINPNGRLKK